MKLLRLSKERLAIQLGLREKDLLLQILRLYPRIPPGYQALSRSTKVPDAEASQRLLDDALAEQQAENRKALEALLANPKRLAKTDTAWRLSLSRAEAEWILQMLNDIRIGSWLALGAPEEGPRAFTETTAPHIWAMEVSGLFEAGFLEILHGKGDA